MWRMCKNWILWMHTCSFDLANWLFFTTTGVYVVICKAFPPLSFQAFLTALVFLCIMFVWLFWESFGVSSLFSCILNTFSVNDLPVCSSKALQCVVSALLDCTYPLLFVELLLDSWASTFQLLCLLSLLLIYQYWNMCWIDPSWQVSAHPCHSPTPVPGGSVGEKQRTKLRKTCGSSLVSEGKIPKQNAKRCKGSDSPCPTISPDPQLVSEQCLHCQNSLPPQFHCWACHCMVCNISLVSVGQLCALPPSCPQELVCWGSSEWEIEKTLTLCKHFSLTDKTLVFYQYLFW